MPLEIKHLRALVHMWPRRFEPQSADVQTAFHIATKLERDPKSPMHLRALAWHLVNDSHAAVGWELPTEISLAQCRAAADSTSHATSLLIAEISDQVSGSDGPVILLGLSAVSQQLFGRFDLFQTEGALLVSLSSDSRAHAEAEHLAPAPGVRWATPGRLRGLLQDHCARTTLDGTEVLIPDPLLILARTSKRTVRPTAPETIVFLAAASRTSVAHGWDEALRMARELGNGDTPLEVAVRLGLHSAYGLHLGTLQRISLYLRSRLPHR